jgi:hypothetical protein
MSDAFLPNTDRSSFLIHRFSWEAKMIYQVITGATIKDRAAKECLLSNATPIQLLRYISVVIGK